eukprot:sb/3471865/
MTSHISITTMTWVIPLFVVLIVICVAAAVVVFFFYQRRKRVYTNKMNTTYNPLYPTMRSVVPDSWEIKPDQLRITTKLGEGAFGKVSKGTIKKDGVEVLVAVKMLKDDSFSEQEAEALWKEIALMKKVGSHPHIVNIMGCVTVKAPIYLLVEFVANGDLQVSLCNHGNGVLVTMVT